MKGTYKSHFSLSDLYFLLATIRCRCSFNSGDAICVGALMYGGQQDIKFYNKLIYYILYNI